jgi:alpha-glucosidase (family GH31 glycosyl hydrolase)
MELMSRWNKELFPDHVAFLKDLRDRKLKTTLNTHPADGVRAFEKPYEAMCKALGRDSSKGVVRPKPLPLARCPTDNQPIPFECADKKFFDEYLKLLHHPLEDEGVDFWWLDWQQGPHSEIKGVDPLWVLNHYHFLDSGRKGDRRFTFSRYAGPGSHRYPIGFSGVSQSSELMGKS